MMPVSNANSAALLILQRADAVSAAAENGKSSSDSLIPIANGQSGKVGASKLPTRAQSGIAESMFSVNYVSINKLKLRLIERVGKALGVYQDDYGSRDEFAAALRKAVGRLELEGGQAAVTGLEKELGLDKLGVSLEDVINSAKDPEKNDKLTKALENEYGKEKGDAEVSNALAVRSDEIGLYNVASAQKPA